MQVSEQFPLSGVIGIVANAADEIDQAVASGLTCVEIRADLLLESGLSDDALLNIVKRAKSQELATLFTLRHPTHGGKFAGTEQQRASISRQAIDAGADLVDVEWDTGAAKLLQPESSKLLLSYHNFTGMPDNAELSALTETMSRGNPRAIKIVPTASTLQHALQMLNWVTPVADSSVTRIGFAMGPLGACSRVLTIAFGAPITYASFGAAVAPGQVAMDELLQNYRAMNLNSATSLVAVVGDDTENEVTELNRQFHSEKANKVAIGFSVQLLSELETLAKSLRIEDIRKV